MFYKINNKYYVKMSNYYKEVVVEGDNVVPSKLDNTRIYDMQISAIPISYEDILKENIRNPRRREK